MMRKWGNTERESVIWKDDISVCLSVSLSQPPCLSRERSFLCFSAMQSPIEHSPCLWSLNTDTYAATSRYP